MVSSHTYIQNICLDIKVHHRSRRVSFPNPPNSSRCFHSKGAFATRSLSEGSIVAPMPLVPLSKFVLELDKDPTDGTYSNKQLLLNYCFGHPQSSLLFFPYSSTVHFINHSDDPNSFVRWSESDLSQTENFDREPSEVYTGLIMEVVALRDLKLGEEVTLDYGEAWTEAWNNHVSNWANHSDESPINPATIVETMNEDTNKSKPIKTVKEQENSPYPTCVRTACYSSEHNGTYVYTNFAHENLRFCHIQDRVRKGDEYWYEAKMTQTTFLREGVGEDDVVKNIPRYAIKFVMGEYCSDMHLITSFRHEINVPLDMYPKHWLDYQEDADDDEEEEDEDAYDDDEEDGESEVKAGYIGSRR